MRTNVEHVRCFCDKPLIHSTAKKEEEEKIKQNKTTHCEFHAEFPFYEVEKLELS